MKGASEWAALLRLVMYDIIGLVIPGLAFLYLLLNYLERTSALRGWVENVKTQTAPQIVAVLIAGYVLGYLLQSISYHHFSFFRYFGWRLLGKPKPKEGKQSTGVSAAGTFSRAHFEETEFFRIAQQKIAHAVGIEDSDKLTYNDIQNLAFSLGGDEVDQARHFRFRSDLCGGFATLMILDLIGTVVLWGASGHFVWCSLPVVCLVWLGFLGRWPWGSLTGRFWWVCPVLLLAGAVLLFYLEGAPPAMWWTVPLLVAVWFFFLHRSYFYGDIGGRIVFYIAVTAAARPPVG